MRGSVLWDALGNQHRQKPVASGMCPEVGGGLLRLATGISLTTGQRGSLPANRMSLFPSPSTARLYHVVIKGGRETLVPPWPLPHSHLKRPPFPGSLWKQLASPSLLQQLEHEWQGVFIPCLAPGPSPSPLCCLPGAKWLDGAQKLSLSLLSLLHLEEPVWNLPRDERARVNQATSGFYPPSLH